MIDSIRLIKTLAKEEVEAILSTEHRIEQLTNTGTGEIHISFWLNNVMRIKVDGERLIIFGSLSQYYLGNFNSLKWNQVPQAFQKLQETLRIDLNDARLLRIDLEGTFSTKYTVKSYWDYLGHRGSMIRFRSNGTLYYKNTTRTICLYDKGKKIRKELGAVNGPNGNLMRFEVRYTGYLKPIAHQIGIASLSVSDLLKPQVQQILLRKWYQEYLDISKEDLPHFNLDNVRSVREFRRALVTMAIDFLGGQNKVIEMILRAKSTTLDFSSDLTYKLKRVVLNAGSGHETLQKSSHLAELNQSMELCFNKYQLSINESN